MEETPAAGELSLSLVIVSIQRSREIESQEDKQDDDGHARYKTCCDCEI